MINYYLISIKGKQNKYFLKTLFKQNIKIENIKYKKDEIIIKTSYEEYKKILKINTSCKIDIIKTSGLRRLEQLYQKYKTSLIIFVISVLFIIFISNLVLFINIETNNKEIKKEIEEELVKNKINMYSYRKKYKTLKEITTKIKNNNSKEIEWIEIEQKGVYLNIKIIPRVQKKDTDKTKYQDIVAKKDGYIRKIVSERGQILKNIDDYVKKGDIVISGNILKNEKVIGKVRATGKIYAEVWYIVKLNEDIYHQKAEEKERGRTTLSIITNSKEINIISIKNKIKSNKRKTLFKNNNYEFVLDNKKSFYLKKEKYNQNELKNILELKAKKEVLKTLEQDEYIILQKTLKKYVKNDKMYIEIFFKCYEDIAQAKQLQKIEEKKEGKQ